MGDLSSLELLSDKKLMEMLWENAPEVNDKIIELVCSRDLLAELEEIFMQKFLENAPNLRELTKVAIKVGLDFDSVCESLGVSLGEEDGGYTISQMDFANFMSHFGYDLLGFADAQKEELDEEVEENDEDIYSVVKKQGAMLSARNLEIYSPQLKGVNFIGVSGLKYQQLPKDGHCLYNAVALYLEQDVKSLRQIVAANLEHNIERYKQFIILPHGKIIEDYIEDIRSSNAWAGDLEINILIRLLDRPIISIGPDGKIANLQVLELTNGEPIFVYYDNMAHYDGAILLPNYNGSEILRALLQEVPANTPLHSLTGSPGRRLESYNVGSCSAPVLFSKPLLSRQQGPHNVFNFVVDEKEKVDGRESVISLGWYFPSGGQWPGKYHKAGIAIDNWSNLVIKLKSGEDEVIQRFTDVIFGLLNPNTPITIVAVPSSTANNTQHGASRLASAIAAKNPGYLTCGNSYLVREITVTAAHSGGARNPGLHERTIAVKRREQFRGKTILLLDDVVTTGTVINVCKKKLLEAGASKVVCLTLAKTISSNRRRYEDFPLRPLCENLTDIGLNRDITILLGDNYKIAKIWYNEDVADITEKLGKFKF